MANAVCFASNEEKLIIYVFDTIFFQIIMDLWKGIFIGPFWPFKFKETEDGDTLTVEANLLESERTGKLTCIDKPDKGCTLCGFNVKYTDVLIISQFVDKNGQILPRWVSGLCGYQQTLMNQNLHKAQRAGLMPNLRPPRKDGKKRTSNMSTYAWKKYNVYYEDWDKIPVA